MGNRFEIEFEYSDALSNWEWRRQRCSVIAEDEFEARSKCICMYGLGKDCQYRILSVKGETKWN